MARKSRSRTIHAPTDVVWSALARFDRIVDWAPDVDHSEATTKPATGEGAGRRVQVKRLVLIEVVTEWVEESTMAYTIEGMPFPADRVVNRWELERAGPEHTTVTVTIDITPEPTPWSRLLAPIAALSLGRANAQMLGGLARSVETAN